MEVAIGVVALLIGLLIGYVALGKTTLNRAKTQAKAILNTAKKDAELDKKAKIFEAKEQIIKLKSEGSRTVQKKENELRETLNRAKQKERSLADKFNNIKRRESDMDNKRRNLDQQIEALGKKNDAVDKLRSEEIERLEKVADLTQDEAKEQMLAAVKQKSKNQAIAISKQIIDEAKLNAVKESKKIVLQTIQRTAAETAVENTTSNFHIQSDEVKGRIIGREGRNIRAIEAATGVELIIDDTPETIILSCFDSVRREVARLALHRLVSDGRIHPGRIEEVVNKTKKDMENELMEIGERTVVDLGIIGLHPKLIRMVGRMRYRSSYGQNLLKHSREVANLCATMAAEMGLDAKKAKRAGLLHDIGKVHEDDAETPHALSGMALAQKYGEKDDVCNAIGAHHDEIEMTTLLAPVVQACDAISGARPGARRESTQSYIQRLKDLEDIAYGFKHVEKVFAFQAGRELRVMVNSEKTSDKDSENLSFEISQKIMKEMTFPGQIKVTVIREKRSINIAK